MSGMKGTVQRRLCLCRRGMRTVLLWCRVFVFYACRVEVEGSRWGAGFIGFAVCCALEFRTLRGNGLVKLGPANITGGLWKIRHWMDKLCSLFVSLAVVHLKLLFKPLKSSKSTDKCVVFNHLIFFKSGQRENIYPYSKTVILMFQTESLSFFPQSISLETYGIASRGA